VIAESERLEDTDNRGAGIDSNIHLSIRGCGAERIVDDLVGANLAMHECDRYRSSEPLLIVLPPPVKRLGVVGDAPFASP
jgi:hypothetical protein